MPFELLTKDEAAKRARISRRSLDHLVKLGRGPALTCIGGKRLVRTDVLAEWMDRCTQPVPQTAPQQAAA